MFDAHERARSGEHPGVEREAALNLGDPSAACAAALALLRSRPVGEWCSGAWLKRNSSGDVLRRVRQLRDEYGYPIEVDLRTTGGVRQAWYRLTGPRLTLDPWTG